MENLPGISFVQYQFAFVILGEPIDFSLFHSSHCFPSKMINHSSMEPTRIGKMSQKASQSCEGITASGKKCENSAKEIVGEKHYCLIHAKVAKKDNSNTSAPKPRQAPVASPAKSSAFTEISNPPVCFSDSLIGEYSFLSNFFPQEFRFRGMTWGTTEHAFQAMKHYYKSENPDVLSLFFKIKNAPTPERAKELGNSRSSIKGWFENPKTHLEETTTACAKLEKLYTSGDIMLFEILDEKFSQYKNLREKLLSTSDRIIRFNDRDTYLGTGIDGKGENILGKLLMELRFKLR